MNKEHTYVLTLEPGYHFNFAYSEYWRVWIDYNHNGEFSTNELVYSNNGYWNRTGHIEIPSGTMEGETKMRISMKYGSYPSSCEVFTWGEVEDYKVHIIP